MSSAPENRPGELSARPRTSPRAPFGVALWLLVSAMMSAGGWILSALHALNARGYVGLLALEAVVVVIWLRSRGFADFNRAKWRRWGRRFRRPLPLGFLVLAVLAAVGGVLYAPVNYDALAYRVPRVLHWLEQGHWHWVHTDFPRLNVRACGQEWLIAPLLALTGSIRGVFLVSWVSYLLLPGLCFSFFLRFGLRRRVAWHWMWIMATAYGYVTQAGSIANDLIGAAYMLAAFDFALRLRESQRPADARWFMLAAALMSGAKASNLPLLLPLLVIVFPSWPVWFKAPLKNFLVMVFAGLASFLPTAAMNWKYCHDWTGMTLEGPMRSPWQQLPFNALIWVIQNCTPPVFVLAGWWRHALAKFFSSTPQLAQYFQASELQTEEVAGIGLGIVALLVISLVAGRAIRRRIEASKKETPRAITLVARNWFVWALYIALVVYGLKAQVVVSSARLLVPYYAILIAPWLLLLPEELLRQRWWRRCVGLVFAAAIGVVIMSPGRPLWPAQTVLAALAKAHPGSTLIARTQKVYSVYANRSDGFAPLVKQLPPDATVLGFITFDDPEASLWWPLGTRRIEHVTATDTRQDVAARGIKYILVNARHADFGRPPIEEQLKKYDAELVLTVPLTLRARLDMTDWYVMRLKPEPQ